MKLLLDALLDADSFMEIHARWAKELIVGFARLEGRPLGIVANQPKVKGGVLFVDSADKAARFIWTCNAFNVPLLFLADVPGFMIGTQVERQGIIRHGAKMISAVSEATVPKISVIVRKAYGAGLYAMAGPAFDPDCCLALPSASIAVMGPQAAINAVYYNQLQAIADEAERAAETERLRAEYAADIDILHLASELVVDAVIEPDDLRPELIRRFALAAERRREWPARHNPITPVLNGSASAMDAADLAFAGIARQAELIAAGEVSSRELVELYLGRIERYDKQLNAYKTVFAERALLEADQADARRGAGGSARCSGCRSRSRTTPTWPATSPPTGRARPSGSRAPIRRSCAVCARPARSCSARPTCPS